jgi:hypothetical protein
VAVAGDEEAVVAVGSEALWPAAEVPRLLGVLLVLGLELVGQLFPQTGVPVACLGHLLALKTFVAQSEGARPKDRVDTQLLIQQAKPETSPTHVRLWH